MINLETVGILPALVMLVIFAGVIFMVGLCILSARALDKIPADAVLFPQKEGG